MAAMTDPSAAGTQILIGDHLVGCQRAPRAAVQAALPWPPVSWRTSEFSHQRAPDRDGDGDGDRGDEGRPDGDRGDRVTRNAMRGEHTNVERL
jgi:hypothetical protein